MPALEDVYILSAKRTAIGTFGGSLAATPPTTLAVETTKAAIVEADIDSALVGHVVFGNVIHTEPRDMYLSRVTAIESGLSPEVPAMTLNRLCGSGLQAVISAAQLLDAKECEIAVAGGAENMSRSPFASNQIRSGTKMGDHRLTDMMIGALTDPFGHGHMGATGENVAHKYSISRERQDAFACESHKRAANAQSAGYFSSQIVPLTIKRGREDILFDQDEHVRPDVTTEELSMLRAVFKKDGTVTAGNASGINDGAASIVLANRTGLGGKARARIVGYGHSGVQPEIMGIGPVPAVQRLLKDTDLSIDRFEVIESNEAFASQACAVSDGLHFDPSAVNPNGGAIALGHPIGATGAILVTKALHELERRGGGLALITMCIGGGQGIALAIETCNQ